MSHSNGKRAHPVTAIRDADDRKTRIRNLNDAMRVQFAGGYITITSGIKALGAETLSAIVAAVRSFTAFDANNDPWDEHDFGAVTIASHSVFWKFDYYDKKLEYGSPDPSDPEVTTRVLTIMLDSEY